MTISDLGAGLSPRISYQAGRQEWPGSGNLESEVGTSWKQLGRGVRSSRETDAWVHEGCPGPREWGPWADQSQVSWEVVAEGVGVLAAGRGADRVPALERESERWTPSGASRVQAPFRGPQGTRSRRTIPEESRAAPSPQGSTPVWAGVADGLAGCLLNMVRFSCSVTSDSFVTPWTVAHQAPLSMGFSRQEYWSGLPLPSPEPDKKRTKWPGALGWHREAVTLAFGPHQAAQCWVQGAEIRGQTEAWLGGGRLPHSPSRPRLQRPGAGATQGSLWPPSPTAGSSLQG